jgi:hypothetical protein
MADNPSGIDPLDATIARGELETTRSAAVKSYDRMSELQAIRLIGAMLRRAANRVNVSTSAFGYDFEGLAEAIVRAAQGNSRLPPAEYRFAYDIWSMFRRYCPAEQQPPTE